ncbi:TIGR04282 family arsenosugar biosynthesis glycosyltransferase [Methylomonas albis]|uniref:TIGR04282 family arsenosugar biosynthesis glycosyltransferase n=1 Tax=Methylomonas albis TaxID=1854563 RepID=A0ABR9D5E8_9GAMM|nr:TIGR04282 family arsenosugar biosynthesis glycosyltransferase [Methylomonas albis]MBD9358308.1 TIGR04282 family arsenosugar biosynthesis glycosyltransferase [Methylomonas albis]
MSYLFPGCALLIFCKAPVAGQVKTRLQPALSAEQAVAAHIELTRFTLERAFRQPLCEVRLYCAPDSEHGFFQQCAAIYPLSLHHQQGAGLGERMQSAFTEALQAYQHVVLIGCDCPSLTIENLQQAFAALIDGADLVLGPADDGGYVLIGMSQSQAELFVNMPWGSNAVMAQTRQRVIEAGLKLHELAEQWDVDTVDDWRRFQRL